MSEPSTERLRALSPPEFAAFLERLAPAVWPEWEAAVSPPSPHGGIDVWLTRGDVRRLVHARLASGETRAGVATVRELAAVREDACLDGVTLVVVDDLPERTRAALAEHDVDLVDAGALADLAADAGVEVPEATDDAAPFDRVLTDRTSSWPDSLEARVRGLAAFVDGLAPFERRVVTHDDYADLEFVREGSVAARLRFLETSFLVYANDDGFRTVVSLSAHRERQPPLSDLESVVGPAVERALGRS